MDKRELTYAAAIREALDQCLEHDPNVFVIGEGVPDPKGIFGTTLGLQKKYGDSRVMDMPVSENALTGVCIGAALRGMRPVMTHQRVDFSLYALDQIINNAAKWHFMFGGQSSVPLVVRMIIGRGWGQGAQHSQSLQAIFSHIPGLKVIMPAFADDMKGMLIAAIEDNDPVICLEHRWLYHLRASVPAGMYRVPLGQARRVCEGNDLTIVASSYMVIEALKAAKVLNAHQVSFDLIDLRTIRPLDYAMISASVQKTGRLLVLDTGWPFAGVAAEIMARAAQENFSDLKAAVRRITLPDLPTPSAASLTRDFYPGHREIIKEVLNMLGQSRALTEQVLAAVPQETVPHDVPDPAFTGPF